MADVLSQVSDTNVFRSNEPVVEKLTSEMNRLRTSTSIN